MSRLSGALSAADLAQAVLLRLHGVTRSDLLADDFAPPPGQVTEELCTTTGLPAGPRCASRITEFIPQREQVAAAAADDAIRLSIVSPAPGTRFWRNPEVPAAMNRLALRASVVPPVGQIVWRVDGQDYAMAAPDAPLLWPVTPGVHWFQIRLPLQDDVSRVVRVVVE
jgi:penicillin-binding protein 1C